MNDEQKSLAYAFSRIPAEGLPDRPRFCHGLFAMDKRGREIIAELVSGPQPMLDLPTGTSLLFNATAGIVAFPTEELRDMAQVVIAFRHDNRGAVRAYGLVKPR